MKIKDNNDDNKIIIVDNRNEEKISFKIKKHFIDLIDTI